IWLATLAASKLPRKDQHVLAYLKSAPFIVELLVVRDVLKPFSSVMLRAQNLQLPAWHIVGDLSYLAVQLERLKQALGALSDGLAPGGVPSASGSGQGDCSRSQVRVEREPQPLLPVESQLRDKLPSLRNGMYDGMEVRGISSQPLSGPIIGA
uniref:Dynein_C domain-containing protein n=1 Tax=Macrostomum lignano TaxID=282301 RepID=A0A1I8FBU9_9PLAT